MTRIAMALLLALAACGDDPHELVECTAPAEWGVTATACEAACATKRATTEDASCTDVSNPTYTPGLGWCTRTFEWNGIRGCCEIDITEPPAIVPRFQRCES